MLLDEGMDTGPVIARRTCPVWPDDTAETLTASLFKLGSELLLESLGPWVEERLTAESQDHSAATVTQKLERNDGLADWIFPRPRCGADNGPILLGRVVYQLAREGFEAA